MVNCFIVRHNLRKKYVRQDISKVAKVYVVVNDVSKMKNMLPIKEIINVENVLYENIQHDVQQSVHVTNLISISIENENLCNAENDAHVATGLLIDKVDPCVRNQPCNNVEGNTHDDMLEGIPIHEEGEIMINLNVHSSPISPLNQHTSGPPKEVNKAFLDGETPEKDLGF